MIASLPLSAYDAGFRTRSLFVAPGGIGHLSAHGKGRRSFAASDAGMLAKMSSLSSPETVILSLPSPPYDAGVLDALALRSPGGIGPLSALGKGRRSSTTSDAGMLAWMPTLFNPETMIVSAPPSPYNVGSRTRSLFGPLAASVPSRRVGSDRRSSTASDAGMLAQIFLLRSPETVISSSPSPPYDGIVSNALALRSPRRHRSPLGQGKGRRPFDASDAGMLA